MAEPDNVDLKKYELNSKNKREKNIPTIPTTLGRELQINPFLRVAEISLREAISDKLDSSNQASNAEVFGFLRSWKDSL
jgi:hydroxyacylglutathione hydrolase